MLLHQGPGYLKKSVLVFNHFLSKWNKENVQEQVRQGTKKLASDSPGLVDFALGLVDFTLNLPEGQVKALGEIFFEEIRASWKIELLCTL